MDSPLAIARSFLFVPATRPERFQKALASPAGCVILDLEDAVAPDQKEAARAHLERQLPGFTTEHLQRTLVRVNAAGTRWHEEDLCLLRDWVARGLGGVMIAKAESELELRAAATALGPAAQVVPLIESLAGLDEAAVLARTRQVARLAFGHIDFQLDLGMQCGADEAELAMARFGLVAASRRARLSPPVDGVTVDTSDREKLASDARRARAFGFAGKLCIHPAQVAAVNEAFAPSAADVEWAHGVVSAAASHGGEAFSLDGRMIDLPVVLKAQMVLKQAG